MATPKILKILNKSLIITIIVTALSFIIPIIPCQTSPITAELNYKWGLCKIPNPFGKQLIGISQKFYGANTELLAGFIIQFLVIFLIVTIIFLSIRKKTAKILDLTNKK